MVGVREQAKATEEEIHSTIEKLISLLRDQEFALLSDVETTRHRKEKELQKDELEFLLSGVRHAVFFSEALVKEGSETEIVSGHKQVVARMSTLAKEREKVHLGPVVDAEIEFVGGKEGVETLRPVIKGLGTVVSVEISTEQSILEAPTWTNHLINQPYSFKVTFMDKKGKKATAKMMSKEIKGLKVEVTGSSNVKVCPLHSLFFGALKPEMLCDLLKYI